MKLIKIVNLENTSEKEASGLLVREAVRAIVFDSQKLVALFYSTKNNYYKLPGGGIEDMEDHETALKRECMEEIGCQVEILEELGEIVEYRKKFNQKQISYCYVAKVVGEKGIPMLTQDEREEGFETVWFPLPEAVQKIKNNTEDTVYEVPYMVTRDTAFLEEIANKV